MIISSMGCEIVISDFIVTRWCHKEIVNYDLSDYAHVTNFMTQDRLIKCTHRSVPTSIIYEGSLY